MELFIRDCCPHGLAKRTVVTVVTSEHKNVGRTRAAIAVAAVLVVPALLNMLTNEVLRARCCKDLPLLIISQDPDNPRSTQPTSIRSIWNSMQDGLKALSPRARRVIARGSGHGVMIDRPDVVIRGIREISAAAATHEASNTCSHRLRGMLHGWLS